MRKTTVILTAMVIFISSVSSAFSWGGNNGHEKYRGRENTPHTQFNRHYVDPNMAMNMSPQQFDDYMYRLNQMEEYKAQMIRNNAAAASAERQWVSSSSNRRDGFGYQVEKSMGRAFDDVIRGASRGFGNGLRRSLDGR